MQNWPKRTLPDNKTPVGTRCIQLEIPDDDQWENILYSEIYQLSLWMLWDRDLGKNGTVVARQWRKALATWKHCDGSPSPVSAGGADTEMSIRQNPDNPCEIQSSQDGTTWCTFIDLSKCMNFGTQPGVTNDQPQPGGGFQQTCAKLNANGLMVLPLLVNSGDTIRLDSASGAGNDPNDPVGSLVWRTPNGDHFFGGVDIGLPVNAISDPMPAENHMGLVAGFGGPTDFVVLKVGVTKTIPSGVSNAQIWVQVNDSDLSNNSGSYDVCVTVTNNQATSWSHTLDFTLSPHGFAQLPSGAAAIGHWTPGVGLQPDDGAYGGAWYRGIVMNVNSIAPFNLTSLTIRYDLTRGSYGLGPSNGLGVDALAGAGGINEISILHGSLVDGTNITNTGSTPQSGTTGFQIALITDDAGGPGAFTGSCTVLQLIITGTGTEPTWP